MRPWGVFVGHAHGGRARGFVPFAERAGFARVCNPRRVLDPPAAIVSWCFVAECLRISASSGGRLVGLARRLIAVCIAA